MKTSSTQLSQSLCEPLLIHAVTSLVGRNWDQVTATDIEAIIDLIYAIHEHDMPRIMKFLLKDKELPDPSVDRLPEYLAELVKHYRLPKQNLSQGFAEDAEFFRNVLKTRLKKSNA